METKQYAAAGPWISVEEELPDINEGIYLLRMADSSDIALVAYNDLKSCVSLDGVKRVGYRRWTHWAEVRV